MCSVVLLFRPGAPWPVLLAANRDEMAGRPWKPPGRHWPDRVEVIAGQDLEADGTWLGLSDYGVVAAILNRPGTLGPLAGKRSRGELPLDALDHPTADDAVEALKHLESNNYRPFNMVIADRREAYWLRSCGDGAAVEAFPITPGLHMLTAHDLDDTESPRIQAYLPQFQSAEVPDPDSGNWAAWTDLISSRTFDSAKGPRGAMTVVTETGFGTISSSMIALPAPDRAESAAIWQFAAGSPDETPFESLDLGAV